MLGYVKVEKAELKVKEFEIYGGYYCGVCKSIGKNHGQLPRLSLSYDAAFLAALIDGLDEAPIKFSIEHCIIHRIKKKTIGRSNAIDYAADVMLLLGYHKLDDDYLDENKKGAKLLSVMFKKIYKKLALKYPTLDEKIRTQLEILHQMEEAKEGNVDQIAEPFARIMEEILIYYFDHEYNTSLDRKDTYTEKELAVIRRVGYMLCKWIYIIDAIDDLDEDIKKGMYNPFIYRLNIDKEVYLQDSSRYRQEVAEIGERNLFLYGSDLAASIEGLSFIKNSGIIDNVISLGLLRRAEIVISEIKDPDEKIKNKKERRKLR